MLNPMLDLLNISRVPYRYINTISDHHYICLSSSPTTGIKGYTLSFYFDKEPKVLKVQAVSFYSLVQELKEFIDPEDMYFYEADWKGEESLKIFLYDRYPEDTYLKLYTAIKNFIIKFHYK